MWGVFGQYGNSTIIYMFALGFHMQNNDMIDKCWLLMIIDAVWRIYIYIFLILGMIIIHELGIHVNQPSIWEIAQ